jgi:hypothetical protein
MPKWIAAAVVALWLCAPTLGAAADQRQSGDALAGDVLGVSKEQALVVGAGILGGALVLHLVIPGELTYFVGGVAGGLAALWWYENGGQTQLRPLLKPAGTSMAATASGHPVLALAR